MSDQERDDEAMLGEDLLSFTLDPTDLAVLVGTGQDPDAHVGIDLTPLQVQQGHDASGRTFLQILVELPGGMFTSRPRLHLPNGQPNGTLDGVLAVPPRIRVVVRRDRMSPEALESLRGHLRQQLISAHSD